MVTDWIFEESLKPFLETLAFLVNYRFDESDWIAFEIGILETNDETNHWFNYRLMGDYDLEVKIALDKDSGVVLFQIQSDFHIEEIQLAAFIFQSYHLI